LSFRVAEESRSAGSGHEKKRCRFLALGLPPLAQKRAVVVRVRLAKAINQPRHSTGWKGE
jgi:hypothetical protein